MTMDDGLIKRFDRSAKSYSAAAQVQRLIAERLVSGVPRDTAAMRVADLGAGTGFAAAEALKRFPGALIEAIEISPAMIRIGRGEAEDPRLRWHCLDAREVDSLEPFDLLLSSSSLQWMFPIEETLATWRTALAPTGSLALAAMVDGTLGQLHSVRNTIAPRKQPEQRFLSMAELEQAVRSAGFRIESAEVERYQHRAPSTRELLRDLRAQGVTGGKLSQGASLLSRSELHELMSRYDRERERDGTVVAEYAVGFIYARAGEGAGGRLRQGRK